MALVAGFATTVAAARARTRVAAGTDGDRDAADRCETR
jgi:hypothetical protein